MLTTAAELEQIIDAVVTIPTIPTTLVEINQALSSPNGSARDAGNVIEKDPAIATKVLGLVNSSLYSLANPVNTIHLACSILGLKVIKNIVTASPTKWPPATAATTATVPTWTRWRSWGFPPSS